MKLKKVVIAVFIFLTIGSAKAQCPLSKFVVSDFSCLNSNLNLTNNSENAEKYVWDFCEGDFSSVPTSTNVRTVTTPNDPTNLTVVFDGSNWIGFVVGRTNNNITRLNFGTDLTSSPTVTSLGNPGTLLSTPREIAIVKQGVNWYGFVVNTTNRLVRLNFGIALTNTPTATLLTIPGLNGPNDIDIDYNGSSYVAVISNSGGNNLTIIDFQNDLSTAAPASDKILSTPSITDADNLYGLDVIRTCGKYYAIAVSSANGKLIKLSFGSSLFSSPTSTTLSSSLTLSSIYYPKVVQDAGHYIGIINALNTFYKVDLGTDLDSNISLVSNLGSLSAIGKIGWTLVKQNSKWFGFTITRSSKELYRINFVDNCAANTSTSTVLTPSDIKYTGEGSYAISLTSTNASNESHYSSKKITIVEDITANFDVPAGIHCVNSAVSFVNTSNTLSGIIKPETPWKWEMFSDETGLLMEESNEKNAVFSFPLLGSYTIKLTVGNTGCNTVKSQQVSITAIAPEAKFSVSNTCFGNLTSFVNNSNGPGITGYEWSFGDGHTSAEDNPSHSYSTTGSYLVKLSVFNSTGCGSVIKDSTIKIYEPPIIDFSPNIQFTKVPVLFSLAQNFVEDTIVSYSWDFGDPEGLNNTSNLEQPSHVFDSSGVYVVKVTVRTNAGCVSSKSKEIQFFDDTESSCPIPNFRISPNVCLNENLTIENTSSDGFNFEWDFCPGDLNSMPNSKIVSTNNLINRSSSLKIYKDGVNWFGFVCNSSTNKLIRLNFGTALTSIPTFTDLGTFAGQLSGPSDIEIIKEGGKWFGIVINNANSKMLRLSFDGSLTNAPSIQDLTNLGLLNSPYGMDLVFYDGNYYALISNFGTSAITKVKFNNNLTNPIAVNINIAGDNQLRHIAMMKSCDRWYALVTSYTNNKIFKLSFDHLSNDPLVSEVQSGNSINSPTGINLILEGGRYYALVQSRFGNLYRINFENDLNNEKPVINDLGKLELLANNLVIATVQDNENFFSFIPDYLTNHLIRLDFKTECFVNKFNSIEVSPKDIRFSKKGTYPISLTVTDLNGNSNTISKSISVVEPTFSDFTIPLGELCTNQKQFFANISTGSDDTEWLWEYFFQATDSKTGESKERNGMYIFTELGKYIVQLTAGVEGCRSTKSKEILVTHIGANVAFTHQNICLGEITKFTNTTTGENITEWSWDLGDGTTTTGWSPENTYSAPGKYPVTLIVKNQNGCEVTKTDTVTIHDLPVADFIPPGLLCNQDSLQFTEASTLSDGNIVDWKWEISKPSGFSSQRSGKNAKLFFPEPGDYSVKLTVTSEAGCKSEVTKEVQIIKSPEIDMQVDIPCAGDLTQLKGISNLNTQNIVSWIWEISDGSTYTDQVVKHKFPGVGTYTIFLTAISENSCPTTIIKEINIYPKPVAGFAATTACLNSPVQFTDSSKVQGEEIVSWKWTVSRLQTGVIKEQVSQDLEMSFTEAGVYQVELLVSTTNGCTASVKKDIVVHGLPVAEFSFEPEVGPPPFDVEFKNSSADATSYLWNFGNGDTSTDVSPQYTFTELGVYEVQLIAFNAYGCSDTTSRTIRVAPPVTSVALHKILVSTQTQELAFAVELTNTGSKIIRSIDFIVDFGGNLSFKETWTGVLYPEEKLTYSLKSKLLKEQLYKIPYICINTPVLNGEPFDFKTNNICLNLSEQFMVFGPSPNPASDVMLVSFILPEDKSFEINFYSMGGQRLLFYPAVFTKGYNKASYDISKLVPGMYFVEFVYDGVREKRKLVVN